MCNACVQFALVFNNIVRKLVFTHFRIFLLVGIFRDVKIKNCIDKDKCVTHDNGRKKDYVRLLILYVCYVNVE